jgi:hypothetical protein
MKVVKLKLALTASVEKPVLGMSLVYLACFQPVGYRLEFGFTI